MYSCCKSGAYTCDYSNALKIELEYIFVRSVTTLYFIQLCEWRACKCSSYFAIRVVANYWNHCSCSQQKCFSVLNWIYSMYKRYIMERKIINFYIERTLRQLWVVAHGKKVDIYTYKRQRSFPTIVAAGLRISTGI